MSETDYYTLLGVQPNSSSDDITQAYHRLARQYHPDLHPDDVEAGQRFKAINEAYQTLSAPERRAQYDLQRVGTSPVVNAEGAPDEQPVTFQRSITVSVQSKEVEAVVGELATAFADMAGEAANELRDALRTFGAELEDLSRAAGDAYGNRASRRNRYVPPPPPAFGPPRHGRRPPPRR